MNIIAKLLHHDETPAWKIAHPTWKYDYVAAGIKAAATNKERYGADFFTKIGRQGGVISRGGGFKPGAEATIAAGRRGGSASRRTKA